MRSHEAELPHLHLLQVSYINKSINIACLAKEKKLRSHERKAQKQDPGCISQWVRKKCTNRCTRECVCVLSLVQFCDAMARILEWVSISFSRGSS